MRGRLIALGALLGALAAAPAAEAAVFTVDDPGDGASAGTTLREAVANAEGAGGPDTIEFNGGLGAIGITGTPISVTEQVAIVDAQRDVVVRRSGGSGALLEVASAATDVTVEGISFAGAARPIVLAAGANGGVAPPAGLRVAPRTGGGTLVSGTTAGAGEIEILRGDPGTSAGALSADRFAVSGGPFSRSFDVPAGGVVAATFTPTAGGTSELAVARNGDVTPPFLLGAVALSQTQVRVQPSEPLAAASVQPSDFVLSMGGVDRALSAAIVAADGSSVTLSSSTSWLAGEAGFVRLAAAGAVTDVAGNPNSSVEQVRVAASPGDVIEPFASSLRLSPATICLTRGPRCRRPGTLVRFIASEGGQAVFVVVRVNRRVGARTYDVKPGVNRIRFEGRIRGRKLRQGSYRLLVFLEDAVGNLTQNPPLRRFAVRRTLAPRR